ncbi:hypothetical protein SCOR_34600 [Sulfidibacter corallicola]|uniref:Uncharacterized protein n=1 Tax=Sulfidibacter corallicola TaxID=2818388 RepID=A0A8A4TJF6_SULCO|nr:hypothetical protein [Sulfidibacter corallicola]QTD49334.1 hypothetical protein J3U87_27430 [Sulfidibacter corallicola]
MNTSDPDSVTFTVNGDLLGDPNYTVTLTPISGVATGPTTKPFEVTDVQGQHPKKPPVTPQKPPARPVTAVGPEVTGLRVTGLTAEQLAVTVATPQVSDREGLVYYVAIVTWRQFQIAVSKPVDTVTGLTRSDQRHLDFTLDGRFDGSRNYTLSLATASGPGEDATIGGLGVGMELLLGAPDQVAIESWWADQQLHVSARVTPPAGPWLATGAIIRLNDGTDTPIPGTETGGVGFAQTTTLADAVAGAAYTVSAASARGSDIGPVGGPWPVLSTQPSLQRVTVEANRLSATWGTVSDSGVTGYRLTVAADGIAPIQGLFRGTSGTLLLPAGVSWGETGATAVVVRAVGTMTAGPSSPRVTPITRVPGQRTATWSAGGTVCTLGWEAVTGAADVRYAVDILQGDLGPPGHGDHHPLQGPGRRVECGRRLPLPGPGDGWAECGLGRTLERVDADLDRCSRRTGG